MEMIEKTIANLNKHNIKAVFIPTKDGLTELLAAYIKDGAIVSFGGSVTLSQTGMLDYLRNLEKQGKICLLDRYREGLTADDIHQVFLDSFNADIYFASSNAVTEDGFLFNADGNGNRVAAMIFGPKKVILIVGYNKIVPDLASANQRLRTKAAPPNAQRLGLNTPCAQKGECRDCSSPSRMCCTYVTFGYQRDKEHLTVVIIGEEYGF
jgi:hypothetical protein